MAATSVVPSSPRHAPWLGSLAPILRATRLKAAPFLPCLLTSAAVLTGTWISFRLGLDLASVGFLYLVCVVLAAMHGGFWQATWVSVISVACLDYFFSEPIFSFTVGRLSNWVELGAFEFTALIISQLSNRAHLRELEAVAERRETERLYHTARRILLLESSPDTGNQVVALIRETFELEGAILFDASSGCVYRSGDAGANSERETREAFERESDSFHSQEESRYTVLRLGERAVGAMGLRGTGMKRLTATALASLAAIALERASALEKQCQAEAARQAEQLRAAVLDSLAHQFKTPLTVIRTASSGLPAAGALSALQTELLSLIDQEARKLNDLASRLMDAPKLDSAEFAPQPEPLLLSRLMKSAIQELDQPADRARFHAAAPAHEPPVFADRELILTALSQLIDNALKYSTPGSPVDVNVQVEEQAVILTVRSRGLVVAEADRERIFERFYRAPGAQGYSAGTGLGLSIVKTIAEDHGGRAWAEGEPGYGTALSISLPVVSAGVAHDV